MAKLNLNERRNTSNFITLEEENQYGEPDDNGKRPDQLVLTWEITEPIGAQRCAPVFSLLGGNYGTLPGIRRHPRRTP